MFSQTGIDTSKAPATMDEFLAQLEQVKASGTDATTSWSAGGYFCPGAIVALDADNLTPGIENGETTLKAEQLVRGLETVAKIDAYPYPVLGFVNDSLFCLIFFCISFPKLCRGAANKITEALNKVIRRIECQSFRDFLYAHVC